MKKFLTLGIISALSLFISYKAAYFVGERFFFDKFVYRKSSEHGYSQLRPFGNPIGSIDDYYELEKPMQERLLDVYQLMYQQKQSTKDDKYTIALIGDSMFFGVGVKKNQTLGNILEKKLNKIKPTKIINYSMPGDNIIDNYAKYKQLKNNQEIDLFIIGIFDNDLLFDKSFPQYPQSGVVFSELFDNCEKEFKIFPFEKSFSREEQIEKIYFPSFSEEYSNIDYFKKIISLIDNSNTFYFSFGYVPQEKDFNENDIQNMPKLWQIYAKYDEIINSNGGYFLNPYLNQPQYLSISKQEKHPSKEMHQQYAEVLFDEILNNQKWKF